MSGLLKQKKYNWKDSNMALIRSDTDRAVKKQSAESEPAWRQAGKKEGLQIWRIKQFKVVTWSIDDYGSFYEGDSYVILNTYKDDQSDRLLYDVHFWIGKSSTQDEYGTAAYKTVELDTLLDDVPVQHREVQGHESSLFKSYFKTITYLKGGADSGFRHVGEKEYKPRLFKVSRNSTSKLLQATQVKLTREQIKSDDAFILDDGARFFQFNGKTANKQETYKAAQLLQTMKAGRPKSSVETVDEIDGGEPLEEFYRALERAGDDDDDDDDDEDDTLQEENEHRIPKLLRLSDASGDLCYTNVKEGEVTKRDFSSSDVFILDSPTHGVFVWVGGNASENEKSKGLAYAHEYLNSTSHPLEPVTCLKEGQFNADFSAAVAA